MDGWMDFYFSRFELHTNRTFFDLKTQFKCYSNGSCTFVDFLPTDCTSGLHRFKKALILNYFGGRGRNLCQFCLFLFTKVSMTSLLRRLFPEIWSRQVWPKLPGWFFCEDRAECDHAEGTKLSIFNKGCSLKQQQKKKPAPWGRACFGHGGLRPSDVSPPISWSHCGCWTCGRKWCCHPMTCICTGNMLIWVKSYWIMQMCPGLFLVCKYVRSLLANWAAVLISQRSSQQLYSWSHCSLFFFFCHKGINKVFYYLHTTRYQKNSI